MRQRLDIVDAAIASVVERERRRHGFAVEACDLQVECGQVGSAEETGW
jgi:hypothetical protein